jgi:hypothetical protein
MLECYTHRATHQLTVHFIPGLQRSLTILEGFGYIIVTEASQTERPRHLTVLLRDRFTGREQRAKGVEANEEVLFGHYVIDV